MTTKPLITAEQAQRACTMLEGAVAYALAKGMTFVFHKEEEYDPLQLLLQYIMQQNKKLKQTIDTSNQRNAHFAELESRIVQVYKEVAQFKERIQELEFRARVVHDLQQTKVEQSKGQTTEIDDLRSENARMREALQNIYSMFSHGHGKVYVKAARIAGSALACQPKEEN